MRDAHDSRTMPETSNLLPPKLWFAFTLKAHPCYFYAIFYIRVDREVVGRNCRNYLLGQVELKGEKRTRNDPSVLDFLFCGIWGAQSNSLFFF